jgi:hypothetical protein
MNALKTSLHATWKALLKRGAHPALRRHFAEVMITLNGAAARDDQTGSKHV